MSFLDFAKTPPMGWNSWDSYGASVREDEFRAQAQYMAQHLRDYGWQYAVVDIQWSEPQADSSRYHDFYPLCMDQYSRLIPAKNRFPSARNGVGFKKLAHDVHEQGLKFGIHMMRGIPRQAVHRNTPILGTKAHAREVALNSICPWNSDMYGVDVNSTAGQQYYDSVLALYASWGVDLIKVDDIADSKLYHDAHRAEITAIRKAIDKTGRPMVLSLSPGPAALKNGTFFQRKANMWRLTDDFWDNWSSLLTMFDRAAEWSPYIRCGNWPDCDMLPLGHLGICSVDGGGGDRWTHFTHAEQYTLMTLWTICQSPLMMGGTLTDIDPFTLRLLTNRSVLAMHKNLTSQFESYRDHDWIVWQAASPTKSYVAIFNISDQSQPLPQNILSDLPNVTWLDLWRDKKANATDIIIDKHGVFLGQMDRDDNKK